MVDQPPDRAAVEHQRRRAVILHGLDLAHVDLVVPAGIAGKGPAFEVGGRPVQHRHAGDAGIELSGNLSAAGWRTAGRAPPGPGQDVNGEIVVRPKGPQARRFQRQAPQDQRRIDRHRVERVHGEPDRPAGLPTVVTTTTPVVNDPRTSRKCRASMARGLDRNEGSSLVLPPAMSDPACHSAACRRATLAGTTFSAKRIIERRASAGSTQSLPA